MPPTTTKTKTITKTKLMVAVLFLATAALAASAGFGSFKAVTKIAREKTKEAKVAAFEARELAELQPSKQATLQEINQKMQSIGSLNAEFRRANYSKSDAKLGELLKKHQELQTKIANARGADELAAALHQCDHECGDLEIELDRERARLEIPHLIDQLAQKLDAIKKFPKAPLYPQDLAKINKLINKAGKESAELRKLSPQDRFDRGHIRLKNFLKENKADLRSLISTLGTKKLSASLQDSFKNKLAALGRNLKPNVAEAASELAQTFGGQFTADQFQVLVSDLSILNSTLIAFAKAFGINFDFTAPSELANGSGVGEITIPVLYIHWANESGVTDRAIIDRFLEDVERVYRQFSYGNFNINFLVCEADGGVHPKILGAAYQEAVRLCDPQIVYHNNDPQLVFYPLGPFDRVYAAQNMEFDTNEGPIEADTVRLGRTRFTRDTIIHELGHAARNLRHANSLDCGDRVYGGPSCAYREYGDRFDTMGVSITNGHFNAYYKERTGWQENIVHSGSTTASYSITAVGFPPSLPSPYLQRGIKILSNYDRIDPNLHVQLDAQSGGFFIENPCQYLYVEYRKPIAGDWEESELRELIDVGYLGPEGGLAVHCGGVTEAGSMDPRNSHSFLLDCTPNSLEEHDFRDALISLGETCRTDLGFDITFDEVLIGHQARVRIVPAGYQTGSCYNSDASDVDAGYTCSQDGTTCRSNNSLYRDKQCRYGYYCSGSRWDVACVPAHTDGEACDFYMGGRDCQSGSCVEEICGPGRPIGARCTYPFECESGRCEGGFCTAASCSDREICGDLVDNDCDGLNNENCPPTPEICNNLDDNQNDAIDEGCDDDNDDYCDASRQIVGTPITCRNGGGDCNDLNNTAHPNQNEVCGDSIDNDCDGSIDEHCPFCTDSDGGINPEVGGNTIELGNDVPYPDRCLVGSDGQITEFYCDELRIAVDNITCRTIDPNFICIDPDGGNGPTPAYCGLPPSP